MDIEVADVVVTIRLTRAEAVRLGVALEAGCEAITRAEYFIRTGLSQAEVRKIARALTDADGGPSTAQSLSLAAAQEDVENPRRPRPGA